MATIKNYATLEKHAEYTKKAQPQRPGLHRVMYWDDLTFTADGFTAFVMDTPGTTQAQNGKVTAPNITMVMPTQAQSKQRVSFNRKAMQQALKNAFVFAHEASDYNRVSLLSDGDGGLWVYSSSEEYGSTLIELPLVNPDDRFFISVDSQRLWNICEYIGGDVVTLWGNDCIIQADNAPRHAITMLLKLENDILPDIRRARDRARTEIVTTPGADYHPAPYPECYPFHPEKTFTPAPAMVPSRPLPGAIEISVQSVEVENVTEKERYNNYSRIDLTGTVRTASKRVQIAKPITKSELMTALNIKRAKIRKAWRTMPAVMEEKLKQLYRAFGVAQSKRAPAIAEVFPGSDDTALIDLYEFINTRRTDHNVTAHVSPSIQIKKNERIPSHV